MVRVKWRTGPAPIDDVEPLAALSRFAPPSTFGKTQLAHALVASLFEGAVSKDMVSRAWR